MLQQRNALQKAEPKETGPRGVRPMQTDGPVQNLERSQRRVLVFQWVLFFSLEQLLPFAMLWTIILILLLLWAIGFFAEVVGGIIHILLVIALIVLVYNLVV